MTRRLTPAEARAILTECGAPICADFHKLGSDAVGRLVEAARRQGYREPRNANGSRARYFHAYLQRLATRSAR